MRTSNLKKSCIYPCTITKKLKMQTIKRMMPFSPEENHPHSGDSGRGRTTQVVSLKQKVDVWTKLNSFSRWHGEKAVVIQYRV